MKRGRKAVLSEKIYQKLKQEIISGKYPIDSRLPGELTLGGRFKVSRMTVRAGLKKLANAGLVEPKAGQGWVIISHAGQQKHPVLLICSHEEDGVACMNAAGQYLEENGIDYEMLYQAGHKCPDIDENKKISGVITFSGREIDTEFSEFIKKRNIPIVGACTAFAEPYDTVAGDNISGMTRLIEQLISEGYKKIAYMSSESLETSGDFSFPLRLMTYRQLMVKHGLKPLECFSSHNNMYEKNDHKNLMACIEKLTAAGDRPQYLIGSVPNQANMALLVLDQNGISAKNDIQVTGFANAVEKQLLQQHDMKTIRLLTNPWAGIGKLAAQRMAERLKGDTNPPLSIHIQMEFTDKWGA